MITQERSPDDADKLEGWKEIAKFLGKGERTVRNYERESNLPVHRLANTDKSRVWATRAELRTWLAERESAPQLAGPSQTNPNGSLSENGGIETPPIKYSFRLKIGIFGLGVACAATALGLFIHWSRAYPSELLIDGAVLTARDARKRVVWSSVLPSKTHPDDPGNWAEPKALFADVDGDGRKELLFPFRDLDHPDQPDTLYCFSSSGAVLWTHQVGRELRTVGTGRVYPAHYSLIWIKVLKKPAPNGGLILVGARRGGTSLFAVELLTKDGRRVGEYYHPGWLWSVETADLDGDGCDEILLGGVNNAYGVIGDGQHQATLVVLDSKKVEGHGAVPEGDDRVLGGLTSGHEKAVILFPDLRIRGPIPAGAFYLIRRIRALRGQIEVLVECNGKNEISATYHLTPELAVDYVEPSGHCSARLR